MGKEQTTDLHASIAPVAAPRRGERLGTRLDPALRAFIDRAIVPTLVRQYIAALDAKNKLAKPAECMSQFVSSAAPPTVRGDARQ